MGTNIPIRTIAKLTATLPVADRKETDQWLRLLAGADGDSRSLSPQDLTTVAQCYDEADGAAHDAVIFSRRDLATYVAGRKEKFPTSDRLARNLLAVLATVPTLVKQARLINPVYPEKRRSPKVQYDALLQHLETLAFLVEHARYQAPDDPGIVFFSPFTITRDPVTGVVTDLEAPAIPSMAAALGGALAFRDVLPEIVAMGKHTLPEWIDAVRKQQQAMRKFLDGPLTDFFFCWKGHMVLGDITGLRAALGELWAQQKPSLLIQAQRVGGKAFHDAIEALVYAMMQYDPITVIQQHLALLNDQFFVPHGFLMLMSPDLVADGHVITYGYEVGDVLRIEYVANPYVKGGRIRVYHVRGGVSSLERNLGGDNFAFADGSTASARSYYTVPLVGSAGPKIEREAAQRRADTIGDAYNDTADPFRRLLIKQYGDHAPSPKKLAADYEQSTRVHELRHVYDVLDNGRTSEASAHLAELAAGPTPFADLEYLFRGSEIGATDHELVLRLLAAQLGIAGDLFTSRVVSDIVEISATSKIVLVRTVWDWDEAMRTRLVDGLTALSEHALRELATTVYTKAFHRPLLPTPTAYRVIETEHY